MNITDDKGELKEKNGLDLFDWYVHLPLQVDLLPFYWDWFKKLINKKLTEIENTDRGSISVVGNSLGGIGAAYMSVIYPSIPTRVYQPVVGKNELTDRLFKKLNDRNSLIEFFAVRDDPISSNLKNYENDFEINYVDKSKFFDSHNLKNFN